MQQQPMLYAVSQPCCSAMCCSIFAQFFDHQQHLTVRNLRAAAFLRNCCKSGNLSDLLLQSMNIQLQGLISCSSPFQLCAGAYQLKDAGIGHSPGGPSMCMDQVQLGNSEAWYQIKSKPFANEMCGSGRFLSAHASRSPQIIYGIYSNAPTCTMLERVGCTVVGIIGRLERSLDHYMFTHANSLSSCLSQNVSDHL